MCEYVFGKGRNNIPKIHCLDEVDEQGREVKISHEEVFHEERKNFMEQAFEESLSVYKVSKMMF